METLVAQRTRDLEQALEENRELQARLQAENVCLREVMKWEHGFEHIIGESSSLKYLLYQVYS